MKTLTTSVVCSECGKVLRGTERLRGLGFDVRRHKRPGGQDCWGSKRTDHIPLPPPDTPPPYLTLPCEGSNLVGHSCWRGDLLGVGVMCQMCGQWFAPVEDAHDGVPDHRRPDILAMIDRGDFDNV